MKAEIVTVNTTYKCMYACLVRANLQNDCDDFDVALLVQF